jgi:hypothetical protein
MTASSANLEKELEYFWSRACTFSRNLLPRHHLLYPAASQIRQSTDTLDHIVCSILGAEFFNFCTRGYFVEPNFVAAFVYMLPHRAVPFSTAAPGGELFLHQQQQRFDDQQPSTNNLAFHDFNLCSPHVRGMFLHVYYNTDPAVDIASSPHFQASVLNCAYYLKILWSSIMMQRKYAYLTQLSFLAPAPAIVVQKINSLAKQTPPRSWAHYRRYYTTHDAAPRQKINTISGCANIQKSTTSTTSSTTSTTSTTTTTTSTTTTTTTTTTARNSARPCDDTFAATTGAYSYSKKSTVKPNSSDSCTQTSCSY